MSKAKLGIVCSALLFCIQLHTSLSYAWEFELAGSFNWTYEWYSQRGADGFLGRYNIDNGTSTRAANLNFWNGGRFDTNLVTSADAKWSYFNVQFLPVIKLNPAIRFYGRYRLGTYGDPASSDYHTQDSPGINQAFSEGQWTMFWVSAQTPLGTFGIGKRPWTFGNALQYDGEDAATTESIALIAPFGPFDIGVAFYPYRFAGRSSIIAYFFDDPYNLPFYPTVGGTLLPGGYFSRADASGGFSKDFLAYLVYNNGPLQMGVLGSYGAYHIGPEALLINPANPPLFPAVAQDSEIFHGTTFLRYNSGRFFFNAEAAWLYWTDRYHSDPNSWVSPPNPQYIEQWRYMVEFGAMAGPGKVSFLYMWCPGPDRRNGILIGRQSAAFVRHPNYDRQLANYDVLRPYAFLFGYNYGSGLNAYNLNGDGYVRDASIFAARLDYAVASNLNVYGTFFYADRPSKGYSWGCIGPNAGAGSFPLIPNGNLTFSFNRYTASPNVPDTSLGYEIDAGLDWKLLEGWTAGILMGYWQPGKWFNHACIDRSVAGWENGTAANSFGTRPDRKIDPVVGAQFYLIFGF